MMKFMKVLALVAGSVTLVFAFQNCGQPGSVGMASEGQQLTFAIDGVDGTLIEPQPVVDQPAAPAPVSQVPPNTDGVIPPNTDGLIPPVPQVCPDLKLEQYLVEDVKAPSASGASSNLFSMSSNYQLKLGQNAIRVQAKDSARKMDKLDLIMAKQFSGLKARLFLDREDYAVTARKFYEVRFNLAQQKMGASLKSSVDDNSVKSAADDNSVKSSADDNSVKSSVDDNPSASDSMEGIGKTACEDRVILSNVTLVEVN